MHVNREGSPSVLGIGVVSCCGRGADRLLRADEDSFGPEVASGVRVCRVSADTLKDRDVLKGMRRSDRFSKMAVLAAHDACVQANLALAGDRSGLAVVVTTAFGPHDTTFGFLDEILDFGDVGVSPTRFSHSVHNAAASYVATVLGCRGPTCTIADFESPLYAGLATADLWLRTGRCEHALVGYVEQASKPMTYATAMMAKRTGSAALQPFHLSPFVDVAASEGSVFLAIGPGAGSKAMIDPRQFSGENGIRDIVSLLRYLGKERVLL